MKVKIIEAKNLIGVICIKDKEAFLNYITPFDLMDYKSMLNVDIHDINTVCRKAKEYCNKNKLKLVQY